MKESKIDYMKRRLYEYRKMKPEMELPVQRDFPNCGKYDDCCNDSELDNMSMNMNVQKKVKVNKTLPPNDFENIKVSEWNAND